MLTGIAHVNLTVPEGTLNLAEEFYAKTLGMERVPVPVLQKETLAWSVTCIAALNIAVQINHCNSDT